MRTTLCFLFIVLAVSSAQKVTKEDLFGEEYAGCTSETRDWFRHLIKERGTDFIGLMDFQDMESLLFPDCPYEIHKRCFGDAPKVALYWGDYEFSSSCLCEARMNGEC